MSRLLLAVVLLLGSAELLAQAAPTDTRLRDQLRQTTLDLRAAQDEIVALKAQLLAAKPVAPVADPEELRQAQAQAAAERTRAEGLAVQLSKTEGVLQQWQDAHAQAVALARSRDEDAKRLSVELVASQQRNTQCSADNAELVAVGTELLDGYRNKDFGDVFKAREPLTQLGRVRFEELAQQYRVRIVDHSLPPADPAVPVATP